MPKFADAGARGCRVFPGAFMRKALMIPVLAMTLGLVACGDEATLPEQAGTGPQSQASRAAADVVSHC